MPKGKAGILIKCEKTVKMFIQHLDKNKDIIIMDLDDNYLLIEEKKMQYVLDQVYNMQDENSYVEVKINQKDY